jgi:hypothetical protein
LDSPLLHAARGGRGDIRRFHTLQDVEIPELGDLVGNDKLDYWRGSLD